MKKKLISLIISTVFLLNIAAPAFADSTVPTQDTTQAATTVATSDSTQVTTTSDTADTTAQATDNATTSESSVDPGILPDSPFYFLDTFIERIILIFNFSPEKKAQVLLGDANERLAEAKVLADEGKQDLATQTAQTYMDSVEKAQVQITIAINSGKLAGTVDSTVYGTVYDKKGSSVVAVVYGLDLSQKHAAQVLLRVLAKAPEKARKGLLNALQNVLKHQADQDAVITILINGKQEQDEADQVKDQAKQIALNSVLVKVAGSQDIVDKLKAQGFDTKEITAILTLAKKTNKSVDEIAKLYLDQHKDLGAVIKALGLNIEQTAREIKSGYDAIKDQIKIEVTNVAKQHGAEHKNPNADKQQEKDKSQQKDSKTPDQGAKNQTKENHGKSDKEKKSDNKNKGSEQDDEDE